MKTRLLIISGICVIVILTVALGANLMLEHANQREVELDQNSIALDAIPKNGLSKTLSSNEVAIDNMKSIVLSDTSHQEKIDVIKNEVRDKNLEPFSVVSLKNLKQNYEHDDLITFDLTNFGYRNWCLMPSILIYYENYEKPIYEVAIVHSCPSPGDNYYPYIGQWNQDDFRDMISCKYNGSYTIMAESFQFERQDVGQYYCNGKDVFVRPSVHDIIIPDGATNSQVRPNFIPDKITAKEGDIFKFVNNDDSEFWLVARHDSDVQRDIFLHFDPEESREFNQIKSGNYTVTIEIDNQPMPWMNAIIMVK